MPAPIVPSPTIPTVRTSTDGDPIGAQAWSGAWRTAIRAGAALGAAPLCSPTLEARRMRPPFRRRTKSALPPAGVLRRERRALLQVREERLRDLGGLLLEMFRRDRFREDLVRERCEELLEIDEHLA